MVDLLTVLREASGAVWHRGAVSEVSLAEGWMPRYAVATLAAEGVKREYDVVAGCDVLHAIADI